MDKPKDIATYQKGDVFQINEHEGRKGWIGALVMADEVRPWGIVAFIPVPHTQEEQHTIFIRLDWLTVDYIGRAVLVPNE